MEGRSIYCLYDNGNNLIDINIFIIFIYFSGERVMGIINDGALTGVVEADPDLLWPVPQHWSLEDAATVPLPYAHALYCFVSLRK